MRFVGGLVTLVLPALTVLGPHSTAFARQGSLPEPDLSGILADEAPAAPNAFITGLAVGDAT